MSLPAHALKAESTVHCCRIESTAMVAHPQAPLIRVIKHNLDRVGVSVLDRVRHSLAADVNERVQRPSIRLTAGGRPVGVERQWNMPRGDAHAATYGLDDRRTVVIDEILDHFASAGQSPLAGFDHRPCPLREDWVVGKRSRRRKRESKILHHQVVNVCRDPSSLVGQSVSRNELLAGAEALPEPIQPPLRESRRAHSPGNPYPALVSPSVASR